MRVRVSGAFMLLYCFGLFAMPSLDAAEFATGAPIIDGSGAWNNNAATTFPATAGTPDNVQGFGLVRVTDGNFTDTSGVSYWLGRQNDPTEYFVVDLGSSVNIRSLGLTNTHNNGSNDRGTRDFQVRASNNLAAITGAVSTETIILSGQLTATQGGNGDAMLFTDTFNLNNGLTPGKYQYVRFETLSGSYNANVGLNEIQVFDTVGSANIAGGKPIVDGSGAWTGGLGATQSPDFTAGQFAGENITDMRLDDRRNDASVEETSYWLGRQGQAGEFLTISLEDLFLIDRIDLQNSHNAASNDRGTNAFTIEASLDGSVFFDVFSDSLADVAGLGSDIPIESFSAANGDFDPFEARFLRFNADTFYGVGAALNEVQAFGVISPEPGSIAIWSLIAMLGCGYFAAQRRRRRKA